MRTVERRWAIRMAVRSPRSTSRPSWICASVSGSTLAVASSRMRIAGSCSSTRARATSWRWPIESARPRSPTCGYQAVRTGRRSSRRRRSAAPPLDLVIGRRPGGHSGCCRHRAGEQERRLGTMPTVAKVAQVEGADVLAVDQHLTALELIEARDQLDDARLARAGVPDEGDGLARSDRQVKVGQDRRTRHVAEVTSRNSIAPSMIGTAFDHSGRPVVPRRSARRRARWPTAPAETGSRTRRCWSAGTRRS